MCTLKIIVNKSIKNPTKNAGPINSYIKIKLTPYLIQFLIYLIILESLKRSKDNLLLKVTFERQLTLN